MLHEWSDNRCIHTVFNKADNRGLWQVIGLYSRLQLLSRNTCVHPLSLCPMSASCSLYFDQPDSFTWSKTLWLPPWLCSRDLLTCIDWFLLLECHVGLTNGCYHFFSSSEAGHFPENTYTLSTAAKRTMKSIQFLHERNGLVSLDSQCSVVGTTLR